MSAARVRKPSPTAANEHDLENLKQRCRALLNSIRLAVEERPVEAVPLAEWESPGFDEWRIAFPRPSRWPVTRRRVLPDRNVVVWADRREPHIITVFVPAGSERHKATATIPYAAVIRDGRIVRLLKPHGWPPRDGLESAAQGHGLYEEQGWSGARKAARDAKWAARCRRQAMLSARLAVTSPELQVMAARDAHSQAADFLESSEDLDEGVVSTLLEFARADRREDFCSLAGSAGVPRDSHEALWSGTRHRLRPRATRRAKGEPA